MASGAAAFTGISQGVRKGLKDYRQRQRQEKQEERTQESHELGMKQTRQQIEQSEELFPEKKRQQELTTEASEIEVNEAEAKKGAPVALQALESGDLDAVTGYMQDAFPGEMGNAVIEQDDDGNIYALRETSDGKVQRREMDQEELGAIIRQAGGMETPDEYSAPVEIPGVGIGQRNENTGEYDVLREYDSSGGNGGEEDRHRFRNLQKAMGEYFGVDQPMAPQKAKEKWSEGTARAASLIDEGGLSYEEAFRIATLSLSSPENQDQETKKQIRWAQDKYNQVVGGKSTGRGSGLGLNGGRNRGGQESASSGNQGGGSGGPRSARPDQSSSEQDAGHSPEIEMVDTEKHGRLPKPPTAEAAKKNLSPGQKFVHPENGKVYQMPQE